MFFLAELLTSLDVVNQSFKKSIRGYDAAEVDEFLDNVAEALQSYVQKNKELERDLAAKEERLAEYDKMKNVLNEALILAQKSADDRVKSAREAAAKIISDAEERAEDICSDAAKEAERLRSGVSQIRDIREMYEQEFRGMLAKFDNMLNQCVGSSKLEKAVDSVLEAEEEDEPDDEPHAEEPTPERKDLEAAYNMLGVNPKEILN